MGRLEPNLAKVTGSQGTVSTAVYMYRIIKCLRLGHAAWRQREQHFFGRAKVDPASACHSPHEFCPHIDPIPSEDGDDFHSLAHSRSRVRDTRSRASAVSVTRDAPHVEPIMAAREFVITSSRRLRHIARDSRARCDQAMDRANEEGGREPRLQAQFTHCGH
jgi:hypothetical protein